MVEIFKKSESQPEIPGGAVVRVVVRGRWHTGRVVKRDVDRYEREVYDVAVAEGEVKRYREEVKVLGE